MTTTSNVASGAPPWLNRETAGARLAAELAGYRRAHALVLAVPRGGVVAARCVADALRGDLDVVLAKRLRAPSDRETSVGAVDELGWSHVLAFADRLGADGAYLEREMAMQRELLRRKREIYTPGRGPLPVRGRTVIVVDDGVLSGETMCAALQAVRARHPARLICAIPVAASTGLVLLRSHADDVVCLHSPEPFTGLPDYYESFEPVTDEAVAETIARPAARDGARHP